LPHLLAESIVRYELKRVLGVSGVISALVLNVAIWGLIALFTTVGLAAADVSASTFYVVWAFFGAVMLGGAFLTIKWGKEGRRWLWRISISWTLLFLISAATLLVALIPLGLLCIHTGFRRWLLSWLVPPPRVRPSPSSTGPLKDVAIGSSDHVDFPLGDPRRPWKLAALIVLSIAAFVPFWFVLVVLSLGEAVGEVAVVGAGVLSALAVMAALLDWRSARSRYPPEERGSFRSLEGVACAIAVLITLGAAVLFGAWAWNSSESSSLPPIPRPSSAVGKLCKKPGIRYAGTTAQGAEVCFTLTPDRSKWVEIGFRFVRASGCGHGTGTTYSTGKTYYEGPDALTGPGRISVPGFTGTIRSARASGVLEDSEICGSKTFRWSASRAP
jgi:hypothetical protein